MKEKILLIWKHLKQGTHLYETVVSLRGALNQTSEAQMDALVAELCAE